MPKSPSSPVDQTAVIRALLRANQDLSRANQDLQNANNNLVAAVEAWLPSDEEADFEPTTRQKKIMAVLKGRALRTDALAGAMKVDRRRLYDAGWLPELMDAGLVGNHPDFGYYSTKEPPPELDENAAN